LSRAGRRLFFALWPTDEIRAALTEASRPALRACAGRPVPQLNYHVTLAFLGNSDEPLVRFDRLADIAADAPPGFELVLDRFGHWRGPRVLWIGPHRCPAGLTGLVAQLRAGLDELGVGYDRRDFNAHLTLARKVTVLPELQEPVPVHWRVRDFVLVESKVTQKGPVYEVVRRFMGGSRHDPNRH
jgi:RNA 2',3'-cyclic 3'-phosphodiesterase